MHADVCTCTQHSDRLFVLKAKPNPLCKDTTGRHRPVGRSCNNHLTQLLNRDSTADTPTSDLCQTRPQVRSVTLPRRSLLPLYGMRLNVISFTSVRTVRPSPRRFSWHSNCAQMSCTACRRTTTSVHIHVMYSTPLCKILLSLHRFSWNSHLLQKFVCIHSCCAESAQKCSKLTDSLM
jgi:hypothetical protein